MNTLFHPHTRSTCVVSGQDALLVTIRLAGWIATTAMATLGVATLFFVILGSFTLSGTMLQVNNLASRYLEADAARQAQFQMIVCSALAISLALITFFRRASLRAAFDSKGADHE
jgi:hypothetical protein